MRSWPRQSAAAAPPAGGSGPPSGPPAAPEGETLVLRELPQVLATRFPPWHAARNSVTHPHPSPAPHLVDGGFQEVVQQQPGFGQGAGADHHRGVRGVQLLLKRGETRAGCSRVALLLDVGQMEGPPWPAQHFHHPASTAQSNTRCPQSAQWLLGRSGHGIVQRNLKGLCTATEILVPALNWTLNGHQAHPNPQPKAECELTAALLPCQSR